MRSFLQLTSDCQFFDITQDTTQNKIVLYWNINTDLKDVRAVGLYNLNLYRLDENAKDSSSLDSYMDSYSRVTCNLLERTLHNPNREIARINWSLMSTVLNLERNEGKVVCLFI